MQQRKQKLISPAAYAKKRGLNRSTISRQVASGAIPTVGGLIDPEVADAARDRNLSQTRREQAASRKLKRVTQPSEGASPEFLVGARWMAAKVCASARQNWPNFVADLNLNPLCESDFPAQRSLWVALMVHLIEKWLEDYADPAELLPIDWQAFGKDAVQIRRGYEELRAEWGA